MITIDHKPDSFYKEKNVLSPFSEDWSLRSRWWQGRLPPKAQGKDLFLASEFLIAPWVSQHDSSLCLKSVFLWPNSSADTYFLFHRGLWLYCLFYCSFLQLYCYIIDKLLYIMCTAWCFTYMESGYHNQHN